MTLYRALLRLYPTSFRAEYGEEMCAIFARHRKSARGFSATAALLLDALLDILPNALRAHGDLLRQDLRYTGRTLRRSPGFAAAAILVAALGIGVATAAFSITDHVLVRPLPFPQSQRLVALWEDPGVLGTSRMELSPGNFRDWKRLATSFDAMGVWQPFSMNLVGVGVPERLDTARVTAELFAMLSVPPALGRSFTAEDDAPGAPGTVVLSDGFWREQFAADRAVLGRKVILNDYPYVVIGVLPKEFRFPRRETQLWTPLRFSEPDFQDRGDTYLQALARLKRGVSVEQARAEMRLVAAQVERAHPNEGAPIGATVFRLRDQVSGESRLLLTVLLGAAVGVLLIACTNLANLLLTRALGRRRELAVRTAMGAGRERLVRQLLTESLVLAACGGSLGVLIAVAAGPLVARLIPSSLPIAETPPVDLRMLAFAAILTVATAIAFGVLPALKACGGGDASGLKEDARAGTGRRTERLRSALVVGEVTASVALLVASGLLIRALWTLQSVDPGFRAPGVLTLRTALPIPKYNETARRIRFYDRVLTGVRLLPGVSNAAYTSSLPMVWRGGIWSVAINGESNEQADFRKASVRYVTPGFFETMGIPLRSGRDVAISDTRESPFVAVVSESLVRECWPRENPIGKRIRVANDERTVVGVAGDVRVRGLEQQSEPQVYLAAPQVGDGSIIGYIPKDLVIRSTVAPGTLLPAIRRIVEGADPQQPISNVRTLSEIVDGETAPRSVQARVLGAFAAMALLLAGVGIHGVLAFAVSQRAREIGVRMVLGAPASEILRMVLRRGLVLAAVGVALGLALAFAAGQAMQALLAGVSPTDAPTFAAAAVLAFAMTLVGSLLPALRAVRLDPLTVIRAE
jgi:predicted permease